MLRRNSVRHLAASLFRRIIVKHAAHICLDAENHQTQASINGTISSYSYDGNGHRVSKTVGSATTVYVYDAMGQLAAEYGAGNTDTGTKYLTTDHLGSTRLVTDGSGNISKTFDYLPFGEEIGGTSSAGPTQRFTGQERDTESGLDHFQARHFSGPQGRFQSPDPLGMVVADPSNPQTWNLYSYVMNNPLVYRDPLGFDPEPVPDQPGCTFDPDTNTLDCPEPPSTDPCFSAGVTCISGPSGPSSPPTTQPQTPQTQEGANGPRNQRGGWNRVKCANEYANNHSLAALFGVQNTFVGKALGGNSVGAIGDLAAAVFSPGNEVNPAELGAGIVVGGAALGLPIGGSGVVGAGLKGATGLIQDAAVKGAAQALNGVLATDITTLAAGQLEDWATGIGWGKVAVDAGIYFYGLYQCK